MDLKSLRKKIQETEEKKQELASQREANPHLVQVPENSVVTVRFVPNNESDTGFVPIYVHYSRSGVVPRTVVSPKTFGKSDPVEDFIKDTLNRQRVPVDKYKQLMNKLPKLMYVAKVLVRGKEEEGVKLLLINGGSGSRTLPYEKEGQFGKLLAAEERAFRKEKEVPNWADLREGYDIDIEKYTVKDKKMAEVTYSFDRTTSKAWSSKAELDEWIENQPSWKDLGYEIWTYEQIEEALEKSLQNQDQEFEDDDEDNVEDYKPSAPVVDEDKILEEAKRKLDSMNASNEDEDDNDVEEKKPKETKGKKSSPSKEKSSEEDDLDW